MSVGFFLSGQQVPASGVYQIRHRKHRLPHEVTLLKEQLFPPCALCGTAVHFKIIRVIEALDERREKIVLHLLPVLPDEDEQATLAA